MRKDGLGKLYDRLTPQERFRLVVESEARGDDEETRRLVKSAPHYTYTQADPAYTSIVRASQEMTVAACMDLVPPMAQVRMIDHFLEALPLFHNILVLEAHRAYFHGRQVGAKEAWRTAGREDEPPAPEDDDAPEPEEALERITWRMEWVSEEFAGLLKKLELEIATDTKVLWEAFSNFSRVELGVEPKKLVRMWYELGLPEIERLEALTEGVELDQERLEETETLLRNCWSRLIKGT